MREIKFRGINNDGNWCFGDLIQSNNDHNVWIHAPKINHTYKVTPATVGQFTGLKDCAGQEIYEGDIVTFGRGTEPSAVRWDDEFAYFVIMKSLLLGHACKAVRVIGNAHDNPELLERKS